MATDEAEGMPGSAGLQARDESFGVVLPCSVDYFGEFISGLLGKKQVMDGYEGGTFEVGPQELANVYHLIAQRVSAQNDASMAAFSIKVIYDNGSAVTHTSVSAFTSYHPTEPCHPVEVVLSFTFVINFRGKSVPEKQTIDVSFVAQNHRWREESRSHVVEGAIEYRIEYTERTWAADMAALIKNHARTVITPPGQVRRWLRDYSDEFTLILIIFLFVATVGGWSWYTAAASPKLYMSTTLIPFAAKSIFIFSALGGFLMALNKLFQYNLYLGRSSFVILVDADRAWATRRKRKQLRTVYIAVGGWLLSVFASVVASIAYAYWA